MTGKPIGELEFLRKLQRLLAEGDFVATYKFALLNALADLCLEREPAADGSLAVRPGWSLTRRKRGALDCGRSNEFFALAPWCSRNDHEAVEEKGYLRRLAPRSR